MLPCLLLASVAPDIAIDADDSSCHQSWDCCWIGGSHCRNCGHRAQTDAILHFFINMEWL